MTKTRVSSRAVMRAIQERRSVRLYKPDSLPQKDIERILSAGVWAPSGLNNQPWRFKVLRDEQKDGLARFTKYAAIIRAAPVAICVFLDHEAIYHRDKDCMAVGACVQNMLLAAQELGYGTCWLGEILNRKDEVARYLAGPSRCELLAVVTVGIPAGKPGRGSRRPLQTFLISS